MDSEECGVILWIVFLVGCVFGALLKLSQTLLRVYLRWPLTDREKKARTKHPERPSFAQFAGNR